MADITVSDLSKLIGTEADTLIGQLNDAGVKVKSADDLVTDEQKSQLLAHLKKSHGETEATEPRRITLNRKKKTTLQVTGAAGKNKTVNVEVRKKRTYIKRSVLVEKEQAEQERLAAIEAEKRAKEEAEQQAKEEAERAAREAEERTRQEAEEKEAAEKAAKEAVEKGLKYTKASTTGHNLCCQWKDGSTSWEPLSRLKESNPVQVAEYAVKKKLVHYPAYSWWVPHILRKRDRIIAKVKSRYQRRTHKFGIEIPKTVERALQIDEENGNTYWRDAIAKEMKTVSVAFDVLDSGMLQRQNRTFWRADMSDINTDLVRASLQSLVTCQGRM